MCVRNDNIMLICEIAFDFSLLKLVSFRKFLLVLIGIFALISIVVRYLFNLIRALLLIFRQIYETKYCNQICLLKTCWIPKSIRALNLFCLLTHAVPHIYKWNSSPLRFQIKPIMHQHLNVMYLLTERLRAPKYYLTEITMRPLNSLTLEEPLTHIILELIYFSIIFNVPLRFIYVKLHRVFANNYVLDWDCRKFRLWTTRASMVATFERFSSNRVQMPNYNLTTIQNSFHFKKLM